jgi:hypothetical protein
VTTTDSRRGGQRPEWLDRKHSYRLERDIIEIYSQILRDALGDGQAHRLGIKTPYRVDLQDEARDEKNLMHQIGRKIGVSPSAWVTDARTGRCPHCKPDSDDPWDCPVSAPGAFEIHYKVFDKQQSYEYMLRKYGPDPDQWPYNPVAGGTRPGRAEDAGPLEPFGVPVPGRVQPDPPPSKERGADPPSTRPTARPSGSRKAERPEPPHGVADRIRRWASG